MSERLKLAESYYAVSRDMARQGKWYIEVAEQLSQLADSLCEQNMQEHPLTGAPLPGNVSAHGREQRGPAEEVPTGAQGAGATPLRRVDTPE